MTLRIVLENDPSRLADRFVEAIAPAPGAVLAADTLVVPTIGVGAWLSRRVAARTGISALLDITLGARFIWASLERLIDDLAARSPFEPARARWAIDMLIQDLPDDSELAPLRPRVALLDDRERFELACSIARVFERYLAFRRDWLETWAAGGSIGRPGEPIEHEAWQRWLWTRLLERLPDVALRHPFDRFRDVLERSASRGPSGLAALGERLGAGRIFLYGALSISPEQFRLLAEFGRMRDLIWFAPDPSRDFWEHLLSPREVERLLIRDPSQAWLYESEPALLGAWGKSQRDFLAQLRSLEGQAHVVVDESFRERPAGALDTALDALRHAIEQLSDAPWDGLRDKVSDPSIEVHATHGDIRQAEVLLDRLLECFEQMPDLKPDEIVVYCSDLARMSSAIEAVFGSAPSARRIAYRIADTGGPGDPVERALEQLLRLACGARHPSAVMALITNPAFVESAGLDEASVERLADWLARAGIHRDADHEPEAAKHGWDAGLERLALGVLASDRVSGLGDRMRIAGPGFGDTDALERMLEVLAQVRALGGAPRHRELSDWGARILLWCERNLARATDSEAGLARIRDAVARTVASGQGVSGSVTLETFAQALAGELALVNSPARAGGAITVCGLGALPGVAFRVVACVGMEEGAWPRPVRALEFDLMVGRARFGDRLARFDDRGALLDAGLCAGERLLFLYNGRDARDDSVINPSAQLRELIEYLARVCPGRSFVQSHPLQAFSRRAFEPGTRGQSFAAQWLPAATAILAAPAERPGMAQIAPAGVRIRAGETDDAAASDRSLDELVRELASPARAYGRHALGIHPPSLPLPLSEHEDPPIDVRRVEPAWLEQVLRPIWRAERDAADLDARLIDAPWAPPGVGGTLSIERLLERVRSVLALRARLLSALEAGDRVPASLVASVAVGPVRVSGRLDDLFGSRQQLLFSAYPFNARSMIDTCLRDALWRLADPVTGTDSRLTTLIASDRDARWRLVNPAPAIAPDQMLAHAVHWSARIRAEQLPLFPRPLFRALLRHRFAAGDPGDRERLMREFALEYRNEAVGGRSAAERAAYEALWRGGVPDAHTAFEASHAVYGPIFAHAAASATDSGAAPPERDE